MTDAELTMMTIDLAGGESEPYASGQLVVANAGSSLELSLLFNLVDTRCSTECIDQIEVGWVQGSSGPRSGCAWSGAVPKPQGIQSQINHFMIAAPTAVGAYDLRTNIGQNSACGSGSAWWGGAVPAPSSTIVTLCVQ